MWINDKKLLLKKEKYYSEWIYFYQNEGDYYVINYSIGLWIKLIGQLKNNITVRKKIL